MLPDAVGQQTEPRYNERPAWQQIAALEAEAKVQREAEAARAAEAALRIQQLTVACGRKTAALVDARTQLERLQQ